MPTYVHCPQCRRAYDAAAGPCEACAIHPEPVDDRLEAALAEIKRLREAIDAISLPPPPAVPTPYDGRWRPHSRPVSSAVVRFVPKRWASAIARVVGSVRRAWTYAIAAGQNS
jgi:hypothetical protein